MPPKPKYTREEIIDAAYKIMEHKGIDAVVAREVGKTLNTTTAPIFTYFKTMEELKNEIYIKACNTCSEFLNGSINYFPAFKEFGLRWYRFACTYPHVYDLIFVTPKSGNCEPVYIIDVNFIEILEPMKQEIMKTFDISYRGAGELITNMCIYVHGVCSLYSKRKEKPGTDVIGKMISKMCISTVAGIKMTENSFDEKQMLLWMKENAKPTKKR